MARKGSPSRKTRTAAPRKRAQKKADAQRFNPGRDSQGAASGPIIRSLPGALGNERIAETARTPLWKKILVVVLLLAALAFTWFTCKAKLSVAEDSGSIKVTGISGQ